MSEFDKLKDEGEGYAKDHPQQVHEGEQDAEHAVENKFGIGGDQGQNGQQGQTGQQDQDSQQGQGKPQDQNNQG